MIVYEAYVVMHLDKHNRYTNKRIHLLQMKDDHIIDSMNFSPDEYNMLFKRDIEDLPIITLLSFCNMLGEYEYE